MMLFTRSFSRFYSSVMRDQQLFSKRLTFESSKGNVVTVNAIYQDSLPTGSSRGTVVAVHGAPGSHQSFKQIKKQLDLRGIRFIGVNFPGFGITAEHARQSDFYVDYGRNRLVEALLDELNLNSNFFMLGHSKGTENALKVAVNKNASGLILVNPTCLKTSTNQRWRIDILSKICDLPKSHLFIQPLMTKAYEKVKIRVSCPSMAVHFVKTIQNAALGSQKPYAEQWKASKKPTIFLYGGDDWLVDKDFGTEYVEFLDLPHLSCSATDKNSAQITERRTLKLLQNNIKKGVAVCFEKHGHYLQATKANLIADCIDTIVPEVTKTDKSDRIKKSAY